MTHGANGLSRRRVLGLVCAAAACPRAALAAGIETHGGACFGTRWRIAGAAGDGLGLAVAGIEELFAQIDRVFSPWRPDSAISRFNRGQAAPRTVPAALIEVTGAALDIARRSGGAFDPTVGPLVARWGFGPIDAGGAPDWRGISVGPAGLAKARADLTLDLCGIAKGWALDRAAALVRGAGLRDVLLDLGGELVALGQHPARRDWRVAVEAPLPDAPAPAALRLPAGMAVATSGTRRQSYALGGRLYGHIVDPVAHVPASGALRSVTVVAPDAMTADGWATALFAAGDTDGPDIARAQGIAALFLFAEGTALRHLRTGPMAELIL